MGQFTVTVEVSHRLTQDFRQVEMLVDTGAIYSQLPASLLRSLDIAPTDSDWFVQADGVPHSYEVGEVRFRLGGRERTTPVVFGPDRMHLLGAVTLESFGLVPDTTQRRLIPAKLLMVGLGRGVIRGEPT